MNLKETTQGLLDHLTKRLDEDNRIPHTFTEEQVIRLALMIMEQTLTKGESDLSSVAHAFNLSMIIEGETKF